jgi:hypothetical protein|tara:strand:- start:2337 stop:2918 length:582 start_codon:yes stop_codon:yes gene_type:complete
MTGIIKVDTIQNNAGTTGLTIDSSGNVTLNKGINSTLQIAVFNRHSLDTHTAREFRDRPFDRIASGSITGASVNSSGHAVLPAGTYFIQYTASCVTSSGAQGETLSRLYDKAASAIVAESYSVRQTQAQQSTVSTLNHGSVHVTFSSEARIVVQTIAENGAWQDVNYFDQTPGSSLDAEDSRISVQMTVMKLA